MILLFVRTIFYCTEYSHQKTEDVVNLLELTSDHMQSTTTSFLFFSAILLREKIRNYLYLTFYVFINMEINRSGNCFKQTFSAQCKF